MKLSKGASSCPRLYSLTSRTGSSPRGRRLAPGGQITPRQRLLKSSFGPIVLIPDPKGSGAHKSMEMGPLEHERQLPSDPAPLAGGQRYGSREQSPPAAHSAKSMERLRGFYSKYVFLYFLA